MLSWSKTPRAVVMLGAGGVLIVALFVYSLVSANGKVVKRAARPLSIPSPTAPAPAVSPPATAYLPTPAPGAAPFLAPAFFPPPAPFALDLSGKTIDQLLTDLDTVRAIKGEVEKNEQRLLAVLRQKLADRELRLRKHGLMPADTPACCAISGSAATTNLPTATHY
jgi:hypothetical protein